MNGHFLSLLLTTIAARSCGFFANIIRILFSVNEPADSVKRIWII